MPAANAGWRAYLAAVIVASLATPVLAQPVTTLPNANLPLSGAEILYLIQNGVSDQTTVGNVLAGGSALLFASPSPIGSTKPNSGIFTTLQATGATTTNGITNGSGGVLIDSNLTGPNSVNGAFNVNTTFDPSAASQAVVGYNPTQFTTNLPLAGNNGVVWQNFNSIVNLTGPGTQTAEINVIHSVFTNTTTDTSFAENFEGSSNNLGTLNTFAVLLAKPGNGVTGTSSFISGVSAGLVNNNTTAGSVGNYTAFSCSAMVGGGSAPTSNYCLANGDATAAIYTSGPLGVGIRNVGLNAFQVQSEQSTTADIAVLIKSNSGNNALASLPNQDALELNFDSFSPTGALYISDRNGLANYGNHIAFHQAAGLTVTHGSLDAGASDVSGTITLTAAAPVLTFKVPFQSTPHAVVYSTGANPVCTPSTTLLTCTGGASSDKITYVVFQ